MMRPRKAPRCFPVAFVVIRTIKLHMNQEVKVNSGEESSLEGLYDDDDEDDETRSGE